MNKSNFSKMATLLGLVIGIILGSAFTFITLSNSSDAQSKADNKQTPAYWVAPMDPNYRRDQPGKSPMGMDLIPVYEGAEKPNDAGPGTVSISPTVVNNLGVRTGIAERKPVHTKIVTVGYVQYEQDKLIHIHPRVAGWIEKLHVKTAGDPVEKGGALYSLYSPELVNAQEELVLALNRNNKRLIQASEERLKALQIPTYFIAQLKKDLKIHQTVTFYSPQKGVVDNLNIREGFYVKPGTTMLSIGALDEVWVEAEVFERQASLVKINDPVTMTLDYLPGEERVGKVEYIYPTLDSKTRTARVRLSFDNANGLLKPNMFAQVSIHSDSSKELLVIPREALIRTGRQDRVVIALGEGSFKSVAVKVGRLNQDIAEILDGVNEGEEIVTSAQFLLDSESSKTSDFKRMFNSNDEPTSVWVAGEVQVLMQDHRMVKVRHEAIDEWDMKGMTMNFLVADGVNLEKLTPGTEVHMEIVKTDDSQYQITTTHIVSSPKVEGETPEGTELEIDHSQMEHGGMEPLMIDHSKMDHSTHSSKGEE